jgi:hypothetical protein
MEHLTITHLEAVINAWRIRHPSDKLTCTNCKEVDVLVSVYGLMIYEKKDSIPMNSLTPVQQSALKLQI